MSAKGSKGIFFFFEDRYKRQTEDDNRADTENKKRQKPKRSINQWYSATADCNRKKNYAEINALLLDRACKYMKFTTYFDIPPQNKGEFLLFLFYRNAKRKKISYRIFIESESPLNANRRIHSATSATTYRRQNISIAHVGIAKLNETLKCHFFR